MTNCILISNDIRFLSEYKTYIKDRSYSNVSRIILKKDSYIDMPGLFQYLSSKLCAIPPSELRKTVVLVDEYFEINESKPTRITSGLNSKDDFWGRMILAFPEVEFIFQNSTLKETLSIHYWCSYFLKNKSFSPIFDFNGIRNKIKANLKLDLINRNKKARIIEDETSFAFFHGYIAYKTGHSTKLYTFLNHLVQDKGNDECVDLQIQDLSLGFEDKRDDEHIIDLKIRYKTYPFLEAKFNQYSNCEKCSKQKQWHKHIVISVGQNNATNSSEENSEQGTEINSHLINGEEVLFKPTKGIYHILEKLNIQPVKISGIETETNQNGHSAHGIIVAIAELLVYRSQTLLSNSKQVTDAIHAATLALEAKELLNGLTPTLAMQSLKLQHEAEATSECLFAGTEYNIELNRRFENICEEVEIIASRFSNEQQQKVILNAQLSIAESLSGIYSQHKQFEEELECLKKSRKLSIEITSIKSKGYGFLLKLLDAPLKSIKRFAIILLAIQLLYGYIYFFINKYRFGTLQFSKNWMDWVNDAKLYLFSVISAAKYFFTSDANKYIDSIFEGQEVLRNLVCGSQGFLVLTSISLFMALINQWMSRK